MSGTIGLGGKSGPMSVRSGGLSGQEFGTWVPKYIFGSTTHTTANGKGWFQRFGKFVMLSWRLQGALSGSPSGAVNVGNLPFLSQANSGVGANYYMDHQNIVITGCLNLATGESGVNVYGDLQPGVSKFPLQFLRPGETATTDADQANFNDSTQCRGTLFYHTDGMRINLT